MNVESLMQQGVAAFSRNDYPRALDRFARVLKANPRHIPALIHSGVALGIAGRFAEALERFERVLTIDPRHAGALDCAGRALARLGRYEDALERYTRLLAASPRQPDALYHRGLALEKLNRPAEALESFERLLALQPQHAAALNSRGVALGNLGRREEALASVEQALALQPDLVDALVNRGNLLLELQRETEALTAFERAAALNPGEAEAQLGRGNALARLERYEDALACFSSILLQDSNHMAARYRRGVVLGLLQRYEEALACFEQVLARHPEHFDALHQRGLMCARLGRLEEALENYEQVLRVDPHHVDTLARRGGALESYARDDEAMASFEQALALDPQHLDALNNRSLLLLARGDLPAGFRGQEVRWRMPVYQKSRPPTSAPLWLGEEPLRGRRLLVWAEQGLGDNLQFLRYVPLLAQRGAQVVLRTRAPLRRLLRTLEGVAELATDEDPLPPHELQCPVMSLPLAFGTTLDTIPADIPYLRAEADLSAAWRERLETGGTRRPTIGLAWAGRQYGQVMQVRDMKLKMLLPLLELDARFVSLQKEIPDADAGLLASLPQLARHGESLADFADAAALIDKLDLVITVDTSVAHLAGALGKPVWIMNRYSPCWRWLRNRSDSPWYPTARLFRQAAYGDWASVVTQVRQALAAELGLGAAAQPLPAPAETTVAAAPPQDRVAALMNDGRAAFERGDHPLALHLFGRALLLAPTHLAALNSAGYTLAAMGRHQDALETFERAAAMEPRHAGAHCNRAGALLSLGHHEEALGACDRALELAPQHADALANRAVALYQLNRPEAALADCGRALMAASGHRGALNTRGLALGKLERHAEAAECFTAILEADPHNAEARFNLALAEGRLERYEQAVASFRQVLDRDPAHRGALLGLGHALGKLRRYEEALPPLDRALAQDPHDIDGLGNRGVFLDSLGRLDEAQTCYDKILALRPDHVEALFNRSLIRLAKGDLAGGFRDFEVRWKMAMFQASRRGMPAPGWLGEAPLQGRTILLLHEQGYGDTVQFSRYAGLLAQRGARVVLRVPAPLVALLKTLPGAPEVVSDAAPLPPHDCHCPMMSLPLAFGTTLETVPAQVPYLNAEPALMRRWQERLGPRTGKPRIGLVWAGRQYPPINHPRDMKLELLRPLLELEEAEFISLQKDIPESDCALLQTLPQLARHGEALGDFADTAALIANLDLLITVDTAVAHLAGALGKPVWIMNRYASCWRWLRERSDSPWYPTLRLFRQPAYGDWDSVVRMVTQAAAEFCRGPVATPQDASAEALMAQGLEQAARGELQQALVSFCMLLEADPLNLEAMHNLGATLTRLGRNEEALGCFEQVLEVQPDHAWALVNRAGALIGLYRHEEALQCLDRALAIAPELKDALNNRGLALLRLNRIREALECYERVLEREPDDVAALNGRGVALERLDRLDEALACHERALATAPDDVEARFNRGFVYLARGDLPRGFRELEVRWDTPALRGARLQTGAPLWLGQAPLQNRILLLHAEQGLGDTIQCLRYVPLAAARGALVILRLPPVLLELARTLPGDAHLIADTDPLPPHDLHCPLMSLPLAFGTTLDSVPAEIPYLRANPVRAALWGRRLGKHRKQRIGLAWAGRQQPPLNLTRHMSPQQLLPLLELDMEFVSLQKEVPEADRALLDATPRLARHGETLADFADTAALLANLDLVVTVDTAMAHLAGAMGRPLWIMNRHAPCWRWRGRGEEEGSPWYPQARLFRQPVDGDWDSVVAAVRKELRMR